MTSQNNATPSPKKVAFSPVRVGSAESQCQSMTPPQNKKALIGTPRSILKISNSPIYNHENDVSVVLDSSLGTGMGSQDENISLETCIQNLLVAKEDDRLHAYSALYNALKSGEPSSALDECILRSVVKIILKDMESSNSIVIKQTSFRCIGFVLNYSTLVNGLAATDISLTLNTIVKILNDTQAKSIYTLCIWCLAMQRISKKILDPHVPLLVKSAIAAVSPRLKSAKAQMEALAALDVIFTQDPNRFATWANCCFCTITQCFTNALSPVRKRAAVILSKMLPKIWSEPVLLSSAIQIFLRDHATKFTEDMLKMIEESPEDQDIMQLWALMIMITGTSLHRSRFLNGMIRVAEKSFQCRRSDANINTFKAWSALIYNFRLKNHLLHENRLKLVKLPIEAGLKEEKHLSVRVAATRAWMSLVYACNEDFNQTFVFNAVVRDMIAVLSKDKSPIILDLLLQTLTALMNGHNRKVNRVSAVMVYFRQSDVQTSDILPLSPALIRDHQPVIMDVFKAGLRHAIVRLDTRSDLSVKKSYMDAWQAMLRTYRDLYQKEIRPSTAYIQAVHTCLRFLAFVILGERTDDQGFKEQLFIFKHLLKAMIDILGPEFLTLRSFELSIADQLQCDIIGDEAMRQLNMVPIVYCLSIFVVLLCKHRKQAYDGYFETILELSGACRQSSESFLDFISLLECDFLNLEYPGDLEDWFRSPTSEGVNSDTMQLKLKMAKTCINHEFGSLHGSKCALPQTEEVKQALSKLVCLPIRYTSIVGYSRGVGFKHLWQGLVNDIFNYMPDCIADFADNIHGIIENHFAEYPDAGSQQSFFMWLEFCFWQLSQCYGEYSYDYTDTTLDPANQLRIYVFHDPLEFQILITFVTRRSALQLGFISIHEQIALMAANQLFPRKCSHVEPMLVADFLRGVLRSLTSSNLDSKTLAAIAIRHLAAWQKALCSIGDNDMELIALPEFLIELRDPLIEIMSCLHTLPIDEHTLELWAQSMIALVRSKNPLIAGPFICTLQEAKYAASIGKHPQIEQVLISLGVFHPCGASEQPKTTSTNVVNSTNQIPISSPAEKASSNQTAMNSLNEIPEKISSKPVDQESTKNTLFTPPRKRPRNAGNKAADVVDLTSNSPKRAKPAHDTSNAAINSSWSPKPSLARKIDGNSSEINNVPNLLQKAIQEKSELDRMDVSDLLSCQQLLNQLNTLITETLAKTLK